MKNEILNTIGNKVIPFVMSNAKSLAQQGIRSVHKLPDQFGNVMKITTFKNHNIDIHLFMNK